MGSRLLVRLLVVVVVAVLAADRLDVLGGGGDSGQGADSEGRVERVVDGDTIHVRLGARSETVRYIGVDTPESVRPGTPVQCFAKAASAANERLVAGRRVRIEVGEEERDRYGRLLAYVRRASDGAFVNAALVRDGYARTLTIAPNDRYAQRFAALQREAQRAGRGLWGRCSAVASGASG
jgi:micrococcal nuclease